MEEVDVVQSVDLEDPEEFLDALAPRSAHFRDKPQGAWIFRGIDDDTYQFVPAALRTDERSRERFERLGEAGPVVPGEEPKRQVRAEIVIVAKFAWLADAQGLPLPEDTQELRERIRTERAIDDFAAEFVMGRKQWPPEGMFSLIGLAQHYRLPTRLLDWTRHAFTAAYFAARNPARNGTTRSRRLVVWAFNTEILETLRRRGGDFPFFLACYIVTAPSAGNPNLAAQQGVFTLWQSPSGELGPQRAPLDEALAAFLKDRKHTPDQPLFKRLTLPACEARRLMRLLQREGITAARLFPGYQGVADAIDERSMYGDLSP